jgi:hypothetical protein
VSADKSSEQAAAERVAKLELQIAALRIALSEMLSLMVQRKVLTKREAVSHFQTLGDTVMPIPSGGIGAEVFDQIANYVMAIKLKDD